MAYVNEVSDGREFEVPVFGKKSPMMWTRDSEKDTILFAYYEERECPGLKYFLFVYKGYEMKVVMDGKENINSFTKKWELKSIVIPEELSRDEVLGELREAVRVYGFNGAFFMDAGIGKLVL